MKDKLLKIIYIGSLAPLLFGSIVFFYWYFKRIWFAEDVNIESIAFITVLSYFIIGVITLALCAIYVNIKETKWKKIIPSSILVLITLPVVVMYYRINTSFNQKAFVRLINDSEGTEVIRIRSDNFERTRFNSSDLIVSYYPVYTYDWVEPLYGNWYNYEVNKLTIEIRLKNGSIKTFTFPRFLKGQCGTVRVSEILNISVN